MSKSCNAHGSRFCYGLGLTESCTTISAVPAFQNMGTFGSAGQLLPGIRARVVKRDGSLAQFGEPGELYVAGPAIALGYLNDEEA
jgi:4-coumarate--CoA ligase